MINTARWRASRSASCSRGRRGGRPEARPAPAGEVEGVPKHVQECVLLRRTRRARIQGRSRRLSASWSTWNSAACSEGPREGEPPPKHSRSRRGSTSTGTHASRTVLGPHPTRKVLGLMLPRPTALACRVWRVACGPTGSYCSRPPRADKRCACGSRRGPSSVEEVVSGVTRSACGTAVQRPGVLLGVTDWSAARTTAVPSSARRSPPSEAAAAPC
jgi:hypothetical protein